MSKARILKLLKILQQQTDYNHPLNSDQLIDILESEGEFVERKTIYDDIRILNENGHVIDIVHSSTGNGYYYDSPLFDTAELRILVDAVKAGNFITEEKTESMIDRLMSLTDRYDRELIDETVSYQHEKTANRQIIYNIDALQRAIYAGTAITFSYFFYDIRKEKYYRRKSRYSLIPYALVWNQERYYLIGYDERHQDYAHYRVDRMENVEIGEKKERDPSFNLQQYMEKTFEMFAGEDVRVTLRCNPALAGEINDQFGDSKITVSATDDYFEVNVGVRNTPMFYGWVFKFTGDIEIISPENIRKEYCEMCLKEASRYS